ncbi:unnamed protein product [Rotaria socialis]
MKIISLDEQITRLTRFRDRDNFRRSRWMSPSNRWLLASRQLYVQAILSLLNIDLNDKSNKQFIFSRCFAITSSCKILEETLANYSSLSMSSDNKSNILDRLVAQCPLTEQATGNTRSNDKKTPSQDIISNLVSPTQRTLPINHQLPSSNLAMSQTKNKLCPRCGKPVYFAEEVKAVGQSFHKLCYRCTSCKKSINGANFSEHDGNLYDNNCYQRLFGPKGVGYGIGAGALSTGT